MIFINITFVVDSFASFLELIYKGGEILLINTFAYYYISYFYYPLFAIFNF